VSFLTPWSALLAAAVAIPLLLLLYMLKLRRRRQRMASTLLWQRTFEDLQANVPFQRLRWSLLLALQAAAVVSLLLAIARPLLQTEARSVSRVILLVDRSASMNATGADGRPRLDLARDSAGFESDPRVLREALDAIEPTEEAADLQAALQLAGAFAGAGEDPDEDAPPLVVLVSDGGVGPPPAAAGFALRAGDFRFVRAGPDPGGPVDNVGIVEFSARRDHRDPQRVPVFARLVNAGADPADLFVTLFVDDEAVSTKRLALPAAGEDGPGEQTVTFSAAMEHGAVLRLRHGRADDLAADDVAALVLPRPARPRLALVHGGAAPDRFLADLVEALDLEQLRVLGAEAWDALRASGSPPPYDLVIFDRVAAARPPVASISFGADPEGLAATPPSAPGGRRLLTWDRQHPLLRHVALDDLVFAGFGGYRAEPPVVPLASGPDGPVLVLLPGEPVRHVAVGFALEQSNWPLHVSFTVFMQNAFDLLLPADLGREGLAARTGRPLTVRTADDATELRIEGPETATVDVTPGASAVLPAFRRTGLYRADGAAPPHDRVAVSLLSETESDVRPRASVEVNAAVVRAGDIGDAVPRELWPWFVAAGFVLLVVEWLLYCHRLRV
jgi:hypothetical protein